MSATPNQPATEEDKKPGGDQGAHINLKVKGQDGSEVFFRIKRSTQLKKLMNAYCDRQSVELLNSIAFLFDGCKSRHQMSWKWKMEMKLMLCCTKLEGEQSQMLFP